MIALVFALTYQLVVLGGSGSGSVECGKRVTITAERKHGDHVFREWFVGWDGIAIESVSKRKTVLVMPCRDLTVEAKFSPLPPKGKR